MAYPSTEDLVEASSVTELTDLDEPQQGALRAQAIRAIESFTGQTFTEVDKTLTLDGSGSRRLLLPERLAELDTLAVSGSSLEDGDVAISDRRDSLYVSPDSFPGNWYTKAIQDDQKPVFVSGIGTVQITGTWGWLDTEIPDDEVDTAIAIAVRKDMEDQALANTHALSDTVRAMGRLGLSSLGEGPLDFAIDRTAFTLSPDVQMLLEPYIWTPAGVVV